MLPNGFTLIETLIVLLIVTIILPISVRQYSLVSERQQLNGFVGHLQETIYFAQMTAIAEDQYVVVEFNNDTNHVYVKSGINLLKKLDVKPSIKFESGTHNLILKFSKKGSLVGQAGTLFIKTKHFTKKFTFLLGQGRFYVQSL